MTTTEPRIDTIEYTVLGIPRPQGSMKSMTRPNGGTYMKSSSAGLEKWRNKITATTLAARTGSPRLGPFALTVRFVFERSANHYRTGRNSALLKSYAPAYPLSRRHPDVDKLLRAVCDGITDAGTIWKDDVQVVTVTAMKRYGETPCCIIRITEVEP